MDNTTQTKRRPIKVKGYSNTTRLAKLNQRRTEAIQRQAEHDLLTVKQKLVKASDRPGQSKREIRRLSAMLKR